MTAVAVTVFCTRHVAGRQLIHLPLTNIIAMFLNYRRCSWENYFNFFRDVDCFPFIWDVDVVIFLCIYSLRNPSPHFQLLGQLLLLLLFGSLFVHQT
jgi:hypothetical protein